MKIIVDLYIYICNNTVIEAIGKEELKMNKSEEFRNMDAIVKIMFNAIDRLTEKHMESQELYATEKKMEAQEMRAEEVAQNVEDAMYVAPTEADILEAWQDVIHDEKFLRAVTAALYADHIHSNKESLASIGLVVRHALKKYRENQLKEFYEND